LVAGSSYRFNLVSNGADEKGCERTAWTACCPFGVWLRPHKFRSLLSEYKLRPLTFLA
jgi:hypothetical protein